MISGVDKRRGEGVYSSIITFHFDIWWLSLLWLTAVHKNNDLTLYWSCSGSTREVRGQTSAALRTFWTSCSLLQTSPPRTQETKPKASRRIRFGVRYILVTVLALLATMSKYCIYRWCFSRGIQFKNLTLFIRKVFSREHRADIHQWQNRYGPET